MAGHSAIPLALTLTVNPGGFVLSAVAVGHHGLQQSLTRGLSRGSEAYRFFSRWVSGPLLDRTANYYDKLHRAYNVAVQDEVNLYLQTIGKNSLDELTGAEVRTLAMRILRSNSSGITQFLTRLKNTTPRSVSNLEELIGTGVDSIDSLLVIFDPRAIMNIQRCGQVACAGPLQ